MVDQSETDETTEQTGAEESPASNVGRRALLASTGALVGGMGLAGCLGGGGGDGTATPTDEQTDASEGTETDTETETNTETAMGTETDMTGNGSDMGTETDMTGNGTDMGTETDMTENGTDTGTQGTSGGGSGETTHIAIISSSAGFGDQAFNDLALEGLKNAADEYNIELQQVEETNQSNYGTVQSRLAESSDPNYDLIVLVGFQHTQALESNATNYPDQYWMLINDNVEQPNVAGYAWANHQMSFQAGVLAGTMTSRDFSFKDSSTTPDDLTVGFVGGADSALINAFEKAYKAGVAYINEDIEVRAGYIGDFSDTQQANNIASSQYDAGADIVYHAAAAAGQGIFPAAQDASRFAIGVDADQSVTLAEYKDVIMGSAVKRINRGTFQVAKAVVQDNWESVQGNNILGLEEDAVAVVLGQAVGPELPSAVEQNLDESKQAILNGDVEVPCTASGCQS